MSDKVDFILSAPASRDAFGEAVYFADLLLDLSQVSRLVKVLMWRMLSIEVCLAVNSAR